MGDPILTFLSERPEGARAREVAQECLGLSGSPDVLEKVALGILSRTAGIHADSDGRWKVDPECGKGAVGPEFALEVLATGRYPPLDAVLAIGIAPIATTASDDDHLDLLIQPAPTVPDEAIRTAGVDPARVRRGLTLPKALATVRRTLAGATVTSFRSALPIDLIERSLRAEGLEADIRGAAPIRSALRALGIIPARGGLHDAADSLEILMPDEPTIGERATALASVILAARQRGLDLTPPPPPPGFDFDRTRFGPEILSEIPESAGVYRFLDRDDRVLYVGKAADLRRRVRDYFRPGTDRRKQHAALMESVHDLVWVETGSEIDALLQEMNEIREHAPPYNVQREVRRKKPSDGDLVLFLPGTAAKEVSLMFVRGGRPAGRATADRRGRGMRAVRARLSGIYRDGQPAESTPEDGEILASWLRKERDRANHLDLSETEGLADAARQIKAYLTDPDLFTKRVFRK